MNNDWFSIDHTPAKLTDWIQAFGALIAILAGIVGFYNLFKRDKNKETEINSLTEIANSQQQNLLKVQSLLEESQKQTQQFVIQTIEMRETNTLYKKHLDILSDSIHHNKSHQDQILEIKRAERKAEIMPRFIWSSSDNHSYNFQIRLQNVRGIAYFNSILNYKDSSITFHTNTPINKAISTNESITLIGSLTGETTNLIDFFNTAKFKFDIFFKNEDKNLYKQTIKRINTNYDIELPEEVLETI